MKEELRKLPYEPPAIRRVKLIPEEMAVTICKVNNVSPGPVIACRRANCQARGS